MIIGVVGCGVVGNALVRGFAEHVDNVLVYDKNATRSQCSLDEIVRRAAVVFVCVATPRGADGPLDITSVKSVCEDIFFACRRIAGNGDEILPNPTVVIKSTVNPGDTSRFAEEYFPLAIYHSPEFLTARCAALDFANPSRNILGYPRKEVSTAHRQKLRDLYLKRWPHCPLYVMASEASELVKLGQNGFFAVKVGYFHALAKTCKAFDVDYEAVRRAIVCDGRLTPDHTIQPGHDGQYGFAGECLPKDLAAIAAAFNAVAPWVEGVSNTNDKEHGALSDGR